MAKVNPLKLAALGFYGLGLGSSYLVKINAVRKGDAASSAQADTAIEMGKERIQRTLETLND